MRKKCLIHCVGILNHTCEFKGKRCCKCGEDLSIEFNNTKTFMKTIEQRFYHNGYNKREWGCEFALGSKCLGYGVVLFIVHKMYKINIYKIVK